MPILTCPGCNKKLQVPEHKIGRWIACPNCKMEFAASDPNAAAAEPESPISEYPNARPNLVPVYAFAGLVVVGIIAFVSYLLSSRPTLVVSDGQRTVVVSASGMQADTPTSRAAEAEEESRRQLDRVVNHSYWRAKMSAGRISTMVETIRSKQANTVAYIDDEGHLGFVDGETAIGYRDSKALNACKPAGIGQRNFWIDLWNYREKRPTADQLVRSLERALDQADFAH
jgi:hypothetical protein